jgi:hypothetical protein
MHDKKLAELTARVAAANLAHAYANKLRTVLRPFFANYVGQKIVKDDGSLLKKVAEKLPAFPDVKGNPGQHEHATIMTYRLASNYSLAWTVKVCQPLPPGTCVYYEITVYVVDFVYDTESNVLKKMPDTAGYVEMYRTDFDVATIVAGIADYEAKQKAADDAKSALWPFSDFAR